MILPLINNEVLKVSDDKIQAPNIYVTDTNFSSFFLINYL